MVKIREHPIKMDDLGVPSFFETPIFAIVKSRNIGDKLIPGLMSLSPIIWK